MAARGGLIAAQYSVKAVWVRNSIYWTSVEILETIISLFTGVYLAIKRIVMNWVFSITFISRIDKVRRCAAPMCMSGGSRSIRAGSWRAWIPASRRTLASSRSMPSTATPLWCVSAARRSCHRHS